MRVLVALGCGVIFALGLGVSGMTNPANVLAFLELRDPALLFVMGGAVTLNLIAYPLIRRRAKPVLDDRFHVPEGRDITWRLVVGAALFGIGWGLAGYCPGPAVTSLVTLNPRTVAFVGSMLIAMLVARKV